MLPTEGVQTRALGHVPDADGLVLTVGDNQLVSRVEQYAGNVVVVPATCVYFPCLSDIQYNISVSTLLFQKKQTTNLTSGKISSIENSCFKPLIKL